MQYSTGVLRRRWLHSLYKCTQHQCAAMLLRHNGDKRKIMTVEAPERKMRPAMYRGSISTILINLHLWADYPGWHQLFLSPIKPRSTKKHMTVWSLLLVCKQDVSENLITPSLHLCLNRARIYHLARIYLQMLKTLMFLFTQEDILVPWGQNVILFEQS